MMVKEEIIQVFFEYFSRPRFSLSGASNLDGIVKNLSRDKSRIQSGI